MVSGYLKQTRSLDELDTLFKADREAAAKIAASIFNQEVAVAISNVGEINQVANARLLADSQVASAKITTGAEVTAALLAIHAKTSVLSIEQLRNSNRDDDDEPHLSMIVEIGKATDKTISTNARESILEIKRESTEAINQLKKNAEKAMQDIQALAADVAAQVEENITAAKLKLAELKALPRTPESAVSNAEEAAQKILDTALLDSQKLGDHVKTVITELNAVMGSAVQTIGAAVATAESRINVARDKALSQFQDVVAMRTSG